MKRKLSDDFLKTLAELRAKELFTREFFETCTDSWYGDEFFRLKGEVTYNGKLLKPSDDDAYKYMDTKEAGTYKAKASQIIGQDVDALVANRTFMSRHCWFLND